MAADFLSREGDRALGEFDNKHPWELCTTITEGAWGYQPGAKVKPFKQLIHLLVGAAGRPLEATREIQALLHAKGEL